MNDTHQEIGCPREHLRPPIAFPRPPPSRPSCKTRKHHQYRRNRKIREKIHLIPSIPLHNENSPKQKLRRRVKERPPRRWTDGGRWSDLVGPFESRGREKIPRTSSINRTTDAVRSSARISVNRRISVQGASGGAASLSTPRHSGDAACFGWVVAGERSNEDGRVPRRHTLRATIKPGTECLQSQLKRCPKAVTRVRFVRRATPRRLLVQMRLLTEEEMPCFGQWRAKKKCFV
ncbi:hypothetical protein B296_00044908 [Ensete ventricosum]|uniref:Uncharacterized protein n=1 Tax=Ensete ventricosum TaxID=4639 RepID=A0A426XLW7_ENSVE|nr:hypothetical protein B296_00044908 [Ensete ventricosum]